MADKKYYWLKLPADFFAKPSTLMLMSMGDDKLNIYMQILTMAINTDCKLMYTANTPYTVETLSMLLRRSKECIKSTIDALIELELLEVLDDGSYYLTELPEMIGSETTSAERQRKSRQERDKGVTSCDTSVTTCDKGVTSCDTSAQCHIENRDRDRDRDLKNMYSRAGTTTCAESEPDSATGTKGEPCSEQPKKSKKTKETKADTEASEVIEYLNAKTGSAYKASSKANISVIRARLNDNYTVEDCKKVIDIKAGQWLNDPEMSRYLRPSTLFRPSNFEGYLNETRGRPQIRGDSLPITEQQAFNRSISEAVQRQMQEPVTNKVTNEMLDTLGIK